MENPAQPQDLTDRGYSGPARPAVQLTWLGVAFRALRRELRLAGVDLDAAVEASEIDGDDVIDVIAAAALRVLRNPDGVDQRTESGGIDDYTESTSVTQRDATEDVYFTSAEIRRLIPVAEVPGSWAGSVKYS